MKNKKEELERKLGQLAFRIGKKQDEMRSLNTQLQNLQAEANEVATEIEKLG
jgi:chromosome segregation ATPase